MANFAYRALGKEGIAPALLEIDFAYHARVRGILRFGENRQSLSFAGVAGFQFYGVQTGGSVGSGG